MFAPQLRERYPHTKIVVFDDWHSCPQWPRETKEEEDRFRKAMDHMNSMYVYCDVVLFLEAVNSNKLFTHGNVHVLLLAVHAYVTVLLLWHGSDLSFRMGKMHRRRERNMERWF